MNDVDTPLPSDASTASEGSNVRVGLLINTSFPTIDSGGALKRAQVASALAGSSNLQLIALDSSTNPAWEGANPFSEPRPLALPFGGNAELWRISGRESRTLLTRFWTSLDLDLLVLDWVGQTVFLPTVPRTLPVILNTQNVESAVIWGLRNKGWRAVADTLHWLRIRRYESLAIKRSVETWCVSEGDTAVYQRRYPKATFRLVRNVAGDNAFVEVPLVGERGCGAFVGSLRYLPNQIALRELLTIDTDLTGLGVAHRIDVIGAGDPGVDVSAHPAVQLLGFVDDLSAALQRYAVVIVPVTVGGGTKTKVLEAMAAGRAVVTTPEGAEGIAGLVDGTNVIIRPLGRTFVDAVAGGIQDPDAMADIGRQAQAFVRERFSMHTLRSAVSAAVVARAATNVRATNSKPGAEVQE